ncbi:MAG: hypothetical protein G01um101429_424 [Parcubacteria group bacterium Gr01-1014_29]|nr:MAG: hypothetical protein G01um101429_424 [Parcubacteria group bacterium Gr01-1014_29]
MFSRDRERWQVYLQKVIAGEISHEFPIDANILGLVEALNDFPFLYTRGSCGGHVRTREHILKERVLRGFDADMPLFSGFAVYAGSWFTFTVDGSCQQGEQFAADLKQLLQGYQHTYFKNMPQTGPFAYAVVLAYQEEGKESVTKEEAKQLTVQTSELIEKVTELVKAFKEVS